MHLDSSSGIWDHITLTLFVFHYVCLYHRDQGRSPYIGIAPHIGMITAWCRLSDFWQQSARISSVSIIEVYCLIFIQRKGGPLLHILLKF